MFHGLHHATNSLGEAYKNLRSDGPAGFSGFAKQAGRNTWSAFHGTATGNLITVPFIAVSAAMAERGESSTTVASEAVGMATYPFWAGAIALTMSLVPGGRIVGALAPPLAMLGAAMPAIYSTKLAHKGIRFMSQQDQRMRRLEMGGNYRDSDSAQRTRMTAINEMSRALGASRRWLGQEALYFHG